MKIIAASLLVLMLAGSVLADPPATQPSKLAAERAEKLKADVKTFTFSLDYSGPQDKPYYHLLLRVPPMGEAESDHLRSPFFQLAQISGTFCSGSRLMKRCNQR